MPARIGIFVCLFGALSGAIAHSIPDDQAAVIESSLESESSLNDYGLGWMDNRTLLVTARDEAEYLQRKLVHLDVVTGDTRELINPGSLACANPTEKVVGVLVGNPYSGLRARKGEKVELKLFDWSESSSLSAKDRGGAWNASICRKTRPGDVDRQFGQGEDPRYLEAADGRLIVSEPLDGAGRVTLVRDEKSIAIVDAKPMEIGWVPQYLPFRDAYLLKPGQFGVYSTPQRPSELQTEEVPLLTMTRAGAVARDSSGRLFERNGLSVTAQTYPYAKGTLIVVPYAPQAGGGIYLKQGDSLKRVWCTGNGKPWDSRKCEPSSVSMSPDGCRLAFFAQRSDNPRAAYSSRPTLKILSLCGRPPAS